MSEEAGGSKPKPFKALKVELADVKKRWPDTKLFWKKPPPPWPVRIQKTFAQPAPFAFDVDDLTVRLFVESPAMETFPVRVDLGKKCALPSVLKEKIVETITEKWKAVLKRQIDTASTRSWFVERLMQWIEKSFVDFMRLLPECVDSYLGCDTKGATMRRYTVVEPKNSASETSEEETVVEKVLSEEQIARRKMVEERRQKKQREAAHRAACEAEAKRQWHMRMKERGVDTSGPRIESKKEKDARLAAKKKQGVRLRKTGARASKFSGAGSALEKGLTKKEKKRREKEREESGR